MSQFDNLAGTYAAADPGEEEEEKEKGILNPDDVAAAHAAESAGQYGSPSSQGHGYDTASGEDAKKKAEFQQELAEKGLDVPFYKMSAAQQKEYYKTYTSKFGLPRKSLPGDVQTTLSILDRTPGVGDSWVANAPPIGYDTDRAAIAGVQGAAAVGNRATPQVDRPVAGMSHWRQAGLANLMGSGQANAGQIAAAVGRDRNIAQARQAAAGLEGGLAASGGVGALSQLNAQSDAENYARAAREAESLQRARAGVLGDMRGQDIRGAEQDLTAQRANQEMFFGNREQILEQQLKAAQFGLSTDQETLARARDAAKFKTDQAIRNSMLRLGYVNMMQGVQTPGAISGGEVLAGAALNAGGQYLSTYLDKARGGDD